ncbi:MAG: hypothetical protein HY901_07810 [Deltaproteobacteria bacterium]|nr:hypothetical protein [Deltaproteobacteria bacterium]
MDGKPVAQPGETATVPEVGDVLGEQDGRIWVIASATRTDSALLLTVELQPLPPSSRGRA